MPPTLASKELSAAIEDFQFICDDSTSGSQYHEWGSALYKESVRHFIASSSEVAQIAVQPGSAEDLSKMMMVLKKRKIPFAVKGGGHAMAPTFSSTTGIQISMSLFSKVKYDEEKKLVEVGAGCLWEQVYSKLSHLGRNVVGGSASEGVGVGGWLLGGGYSLKSNQYGIGIDNIVGYEIVTPDGLIRKVTQEINGDLFQALRGGSNNFGIVTKFILKTHEQKTAYGALLVVSGERLEEVKDCIIDYVENEKRKEAAMVAAFRHVMKDGVIENNISMFCVFDAPKPSENLPFQQFSRLAQSGDIWSGDPAGWRLGQTELSITDNSLGFLSFGRATPDDAKVSNGIFSLASSNSFLPDNAAVEDKPDLGFEQLSYRSLYGVTSENEDLPTFGSISLGNDSDDEVAVDAVSEEVQPPLLAPSYAISSMKSMSWKVPSLDVEVEEGVADDSRRIMITKPMDSMGDRDERGRFACLMISKYTRPLLDKMAEEVQKCSGYLKSHRGISVVVDCWPVHPDIFNTSPPGAAFPHHPGQPSGPLLAYFRWKNKEDDAFWINELEGTLTRIHVVARNLGLTPKEPALYNNLSMENVPAYKIYRSNMDWLKQVKQKYDPEDVMGHAGGHKIPLPGQAGEDALDEE